MLIFAIHGWHIALKFAHTPIVLFKLLSIALFEALLEGSFFCFVATLCRGKTILYIPVVLIAAFLPIFHLLDFFLERLFNLSFLTTLFSFLQESLPNMFELIYATNIPVWAFLVGFTALGLLGFLFLKIKERLDRIQLIKLFVSDMKKLCFFSVGSLIGCLFLKFTLSDYESLNQANFKVLPFKLWLSKTKDNLLSIRFKKNVYQKEPSFIFEQNGNVFLFVVESLRHDAINEEVSPHLNELGKSFHRHPFCMASANATQLSWYSIFFGKPSFFWKDEEKTLGSPLLKMFKDNGYKTYVVSSPRLSYYNMDKRLFGKKYELIESYICPRNLQDGDVYSIDKACFDYVKKQVASKKEEKKLFVVFLDATHFGYSVPSDSDHPFKPFVKSIPYPEALFLSKSIDQIKNRYHNAIFALDNLFGDLFAFLKKEELFEDATIVCTSDHGEEFFEKGQLFHASHLSQEQIHIPFIVKPSTKNKTALSKDNTFSHENIYPFLGSLLSGQDYKNPSYQLSARFLFSLSPHEGVIITKKEKYFGLYSQKDKKFHLKACFDLNDQKKQQSDLRLLKKL
jgi:hypothetical protein